MEELTNITTYAQYKAAVDKEVTSQVEHFVRLGYLLKVARDTNILYESGYKSVAEFAFAEYGLTKDIVSRYISINDRFAEGGYSDRLQEAYQGYGLSKLAEMLTLPDSIIDVLSPDMTRKEIVEVKAAVKEDEKTTDIELMIEGQPDDWKMAAVQDWVNTNPDIHNAVVNAESIKEAYEIICPTGVAVLMSRVKGKGAVAISIKSMETPVEFIAVRCNEKEQVNFDVLMDMLNKCPVTEKPKNTGAPENEKTTAPVFKPKTDDATPETLENTGADIIDSEQIPGQDSITNHPEYMPEDSEKFNVAEVPDKVRNGWKSAIRNGISRMDTLYEQEEWQQLKELAQDIIWRCDKLEETK
ncbi:MAG: hypothetical protein ACI4EV_08485 [Lachnospiraceae bacterium]